MAHRGGISTGWDVLKSKALKRRLLFGRITDKKTINLAFPDDLIHGTACLQDQRQEIVRGGAEGCSPANSEDMVADGCRYRRSTHKGRADGAKLFPRREHPLCVQVENAKGMLLPASLQMQKLRGLVFGRRRASCGGFD
jgi:hypothetical protein